MRSAKFSGMISWMPGPTGHEAEACILESMKWSFPFVCLLVVCSSIFAQDPALDVIYLKNGHSFHGVILQEANDTIHFLQVVRLPGKPTYVIETVFFRREIARIEAISSEQRQLWLNKLQKLDPRGEKERQRRCLLVLDKKTDQGRTSWQYQGKWFKLVAELSQEDLVRRVIVRLEDMFEALQEYFGKDKAARQTLIIRLYRDELSYSAALRERGLAVANPAVYLPDRAEILALTEWERLAEEYTKLRAKHEAQMRELERYEKLLRQHYHGSPPPGILDKIKGTRQQLIRVDRENEAILDRQLQPLFRLCYHEAFHAYLDLYLFADAHKSIPRWLNEGLAQVFETAIVETGEIRIGHVDVERLKQVQQLLRKGSLPTLVQLLQSDSKHFQVNHRAEAYQSDHYFLAAWAFTYYLLFGPPSTVPKTAAAAPTAHRMMRLLEGLANSPNYQKVFEIWSGKNLQELEKEWQDYFARLRADGTLRPIFGERYN